MRIITLLFALTILCDFVYAGTTSRVANTQLCFIENAGQWNPDVLYKTKVAEGIVWITKRGIVYDHCIFDNISAADSKQGISLQQSGSLGKQLFDAPSIRGQVVTQTFAKANTTVQAVGNFQLPSVTNYFLGNDTKNWKHNVGSFKEVLVKNIYTGIDVRYYFQGNHLRYDFIVQPGANPANIAITFDGVDSLTRTSNNEILYSTSVGTITQKDLLSYQTEANDIKPIALSFTLRNGKTVGFTVHESYNKTKPLIIDPLVYSTLLGGGLDSFNVDYIKDFRITPQGNPVVTGGTYTIDFPTTVGAYQRTKSNNFDCFVTRFTPDARGVVFSTYIGARGSDEGSCLSLDANNNIIVGGNTMSSNFPTTTGVYSRTYSGRSDGFVLTLSADGYSLLNSTFIGAKDYDYINDIEYRNNAIYLCGATFSLLFPSTTGAYQTTRPADSLNATGFVAAFTSNLQTLSACTFLGGISNLLSITVDRTNTIVVSGVASDATYPTTAGSVDATYNGGSDGIVSKLNTTCTSLLYSTFIGGAKFDEVSAITTDTTNAVYGTGRTASSDFPTTAGVFDRTYNSVPNSQGDTYDGFLFKLTPSGNSLLYSTFIGGENDDHETAIAVDSNKNAVVVGVTYSYHYPTTTCCEDPSFNGNFDVCLTKFNETATELLYSTYLGGSGDDRATSVLTDNSGDIIIAGYTFMWSYPLTQGAFQVVRNGNDGFLTKLHPVPFLNVNAGPDFEYYCKGRAIQLYANMDLACGDEPFSFRWEPPSYLNNANIRDPISTTPYTMEYVVWISDRNGKVARNTVLVKVGGFMTLNSKDTTICESEKGKGVRIGNVARNGKGTITYSWSPTEGLSDSTIAQPIAKPLRTTTYILTARDSFNCEVSTSFRVKFSEPRISISDTAVCGTNEVQLKPYIYGGEAPYSVAWYDSTGKKLLTNNPTPRLPVSGITTFIIKIADRLGCPWIDTVKVKTYPGVLAFVTGDTVVCRGTAVTLYAKVTQGKKPFKLLWKSLDGVPVTTTDSTLTATVQSLSHFTYTVSDSNECMLTIPYSVNVEDPIQPKISISGTRKVLCPDTKITLNAGSYVNAKYLWSTNDTTQYITVTNAGVYWVRVSTLLGCAGYDTILIKKYENPKPRITLTDSVLCPGKSLTLQVNGVFKAYLWSPTNETTSTINVSVPGTYYVSVTDTNGCTALSPPAVVSASPESKPTIAGPSSLCPNSDATYSAPDSTDWTYDWKIVGNGVINGSSNNHSIQVLWNTNGIDSVIVTITNKKTGCTGRNAISVTISSELHPTLTLSGAPLLCRGGSIVLSAPNGYTSYKWNTGETTSTKKVTSSGRYWVYVERDGCTGTSDTIQINDAPPIAVNITGDSVFCPNTSAVLSTREQFKFYTWSTGEHTQQISVTSSGLYAVTVVDTNGCSATATYRVRERNSLQNNIRTINLGSIRIGNSVDTTITFINNTADDIILSNTVSINNPAYTVVSVTPPLGSTIPSGSTVQVVVRFTPSTASQQNVSVLLQETSPCPDSLLINIQATGIINKLHSIIRMTHVVTNAADTVYLPVILELDSPKTDLSHTTFTVHVQLNNNIFRCDSVTNGTLLQTYNDGNQQHITIQFNNHNVPVFDTLTKLVGIAMNSAPLQSPTTPSISWANQPDMTTDSIPGSIIIQGCFAEGRAILLLDKANVMIVPNPASTEQYAIVTSGEQGIHSIQIISEQGTIVYQTSFRKDSTDHTEHIFKTDIQSGVYMVVMQSPSGTQAKKMVVVR